ncbi:cbp/p300-interacting transactivator 4-like [Choloepus didactylus]|uniref:cbp/p300-interacting transactivator 4-like n=1 Tax=Choloepus didactylus TaxID=27675 RepID=UPI00189F9698|nr:cbp/p300-interacting transactivator 4-like [Choloepus didactylus]
MVLGWVTVPPPAARRQSQEPRATRSPSRGALTAAGRLPATPPLGPAPPLQGLAPRPAPAPSVPPLPTDRLRPLAELLSGFAQQMPHTRPLQPKKVQPRGRPRGPEATNCSNLRPRRPTASAGFRAAVSRGAFQKLTLRLMKAGLMGLQLSYRPGRKHRWWRWIMRSPAARKQ